MTASETTPPPADQAGFFDVMALARGLPQAAATMLADHYITDRESGSVRVFRVYNSVPAHYHAHCDEHLYILTGRGTFWLGDPSSQRALGPGALVVFPRGTVHAIPDVLEEPLVFLSIDTPRRRPEDVVFLDPEQGDPARFMARNQAR